MNKYLLLVNIFFLLNNLVAQTDLVRYLPDNSPDRIMMSLPGNTATSFGLTWRTNINITESIGEITLANPSPKFKDTLNKVKGSHSLWEKGSDLAMGHKIIFTDLEPNTKYLYRVGDGVNWSEWMQYKTAFDKAEPFSFIYFGDLQNKIKEHCTRVLRQAYSHKPNAAFSIFAGDVVSTSSEKYWSEFFYAGGYNLRTIPSIATPGNHEYYKPPARDVGTFSRHWNQIFMNPYNGPDSLKNLAFFIDYQGTRVISLNSIHINTKREFAKQQLEWFEEVLKNNPQKWTIVTFHHPIYSCSLNRNNTFMQEEVKPLLEKYGVDLVLQGHDHTYCRGLYLDKVGKECKNPPMYVVSVVGSKMYSLGTTFKHDRVASMTQLYQIIDVDNDTLTFNSYTVSGDLYDSFQLVKSNSGKNTLIENPEIENIDQRVEIPEKYNKKYSEEERQKYFEIYDYKIIDN